MPPKQIGGRPTGPSPATGGPLHAVVCPYCGAPNDLRMLNSQQLLDTGSGVTCDKCNWTAQVTQIQQVVFVSLRQDPTKRSAAPPPQVARQATTISPSQAARMAGAAPPRLVGGVRRGLVPRGRR